MSDVCVFLNFSKGVHDIIGRTGDSTKYPVVRLHTDPHDPIGFPRLVSIRGHPFVGRRIVLTAVELRFRGITGYKLRSCGSARTPIQFFVMDIVSIEECFYE